MAEVVPQNILQNIRNISFESKDGTRKVVTTSDLANNKCCYTILDGESEKQFRGKLVGIEARIDQPGVKVKLANLLQDTQILDGELYGIPSSELRVEVRGLKYVE